RARGDGTRPRRSGTRTRSRGGDSARGGRVTGGAPILVLDAHAHFHACYDAGTFLDTAARRLARAAAGRPATLYLLLAGVRGRDPLEGWRGSPPGCRAWSLASTAEE